MFAYNMPAADTRYSDNSKKLYLGKRAVREYVHYICSSLKPRHAPENGSMPALKMASSILHGLWKCEFKFYGLMKEISLGLEDCNIRATIQSFPRKPLKSDCNQSLTCHSALATAENELLIDLFNAHFCASVRKKGGSLGIEAEDKSIATDFMARVKECTRITKCASAATRTTSFHFEARGISSNSRYNQKANYRDSHDECPVVEFLDSNNGESNLRQHGSDPELQLQQGAGTGENPDNNSLNTTAHNHDGVHCGKSTESTPENAGGLQASLAIARRELENQKQIIHKEREAARAAEQKFKTMLAENNDLFKNLQGENNEQNATNEDLRAALDSKEERLSCLNDNLEERVDEIKLLENNMKFIESEKDDMERKLHKKSSEADELSAALANVEDQLKRDTGALEKEYEAKLLDAYSEIAGQREENKTLQQSIQDSAFLTEVELETKDKRIRHLEANIQSLLDERASKSHDFSVAREHIGRLMDVMGFKSRTDTSTPARSESLPDDSQVATPFDEATQTQNNEQENEYSSTLTLNTKRSFTTNPWQNIRGVEPGSAAGRKRKQTEEIFENEHTSKARAWQDKNFPAEIAIKRARNEDRQTLRRAIAVLKTTTTYEKASSSTKEKMVREKEQSIMKIRDANGQSAKRIAQEWGYEEEGSGLQHDGSQTWEEEDTN